MYRLRASYIELWWLVTDHPTAHSSNGKAVERLIHVQPLKKSEMQVHAIPLALS